MVRIPTALIFLIGVALPTIVLLTIVWQVLFSGQIAILALVRVAAANWRLGIQPEAAELDRPYIFFNAKTAATFIQLKVFILTR